MKKILIITLSTIILVFLAYKLYAHFRILEPELIEMKAIEIGDIIDNKIVIKSVLVFHNPNIFEAELLNSQIRISSEDLQIASLAQTQLTKIEANSNFEVPLVFNVDLLKLAMSQGLSGLISNTLNETKSLPVHFSGYCRVRSHGNIFKIPVEYDEVISIK